MFDNFSSYDRWYMGEGVDRYGHAYGQGYAYNSTKYDPDLDDYGEDEEPETEGDYDYTYDVEWD